MSESLPAISPSPGSSLESWSSLQGALPAVRIGLFELQLKPAPFMPLKDWLLERKHAKLAASLGNKSPWLVIAEKDNGDALIVSALASGEPGAFPVYCVDVESHSFEKLQVADSLEKCMAILQRLQALSPGRESIQTYLENPLAASIWESFLNETEAENPNSEAWFWTCDNDMLGEEGEL